MPEPLADQSPATARPGRVSIITPSGQRRLLTVDPSAQALLWATLLLGSEAGVVELAPGRRDSLGRLRVSRRRDPRAYPRAADPRDIAERAIALASEGHEVFCGPLARAAALPGSGGVTGGRVVWVDLDDREGFARLAAFTPAPCLIVAAGGSGGAHASWRLTRTLSGRVIEAANRRLAERLEGDHEDRTPSCRVYATAERGWWCFGCARGGRMYDLASLLIGGPWGRELRGEPFRRARAFACERLGVRATV